jgi:signal transduction histidine kinase
MLGSRVLGVIDLETRENRNFTYLDEKVVEAFARMVASSLANLSLIVSLTEQKDLRISQELHKRGHKAVSLAAHNAKEPLGHIGRVAEGCYMRLQGERDSSLGRDLRKIVEAVEMARRKLDKSLQECEKCLTTMPTRLDLGGLLSTIVGVDVPQNSPCFQISLDKGLMEREVYVYGHADSIREVVLELICNAAKQVPSEKGKMEIWHERKDNRVCVCFRDFGPGIDPRIRSRIFEPKVTTNTDGTGGLGLWHCKTLMELQDSQLSLVHDGPEPGATFQLSLPGG